MRYRTRSCASCSGRSTLITVSTPGKFLGGFKEEIGQFLTEKNSRVPERPHPWPPAPEFCPWQSPPPPSAVVSTSDHCGEIDQKWVFPKSVPVLPSLTMFDLLMLMALMLFWRSAMANRSECLLRSTNTRVFLVFQKDQSSKN